MKSKPIVLVAEDDPNDVFFLRRAFEKAGVDCLLHDVADGRKAMEYLRGFPPHDDRGRYPFPDLVILDLKMPLVDGFGLLQWLQRRPEFSRLPVVVLSSSDNENDQSRAMGMGAREYHVKPNDVSRLTEVAASLHQRWLANNTDPAKAPGAKSAPKL